MKKKIIIMLIIVVALILLFPIPMKLKDGGSTKFKALLYTVTKYHKLVEDGKYVDGIGIEILGTEIFNNVKIHTEAEERPKLKDLKIINAEDVNTNELVKFNGVLYGRSNALIDYAGDLTKSIGKIHLLIDEKYLPELDGETNCKELLNSNVLETNEKSMVLNVNGVAVLFNAIDKENIKKSNGKNLYETENNEYVSFVGTVLEETTTYMIVKPNEDEKEIKSADKIVINYGTDHRDYLFGIGRKVVIYYDGQIMESYPAQIKANKISIDGYEEFELKVKLSDKKTATKILNNKDIYKNNSDYDLYYYGLDEVNITINNKTTSLKEALENGKITIDGIIQKANQDESKGIIESQSYDDGGTTEWYYDNYTIIKCHSLDGNRDVYIGSPEMRLKDIL